MTNQRLFIHPSTGKVMYVAEWPESEDFVDVADDRSHYDHIGYEQAIDAAKESAIELADQRILTSLNCDPKQFAGRVFDIPKGWRVEVKSKCELWCSGCKAFDWSTCRERLVAVLVPEQQEDHIPDSGKMDELWLSAEILVGDELYKYYGDLANSQAAFNIIAALKEKFTITKKPL